jgi:hypothetical protein
MPHYSPMKSRLYWAMPPIVLPIDLSLSVLDTRGRGADGATLLDFVDFGWGDVASVVLLSFLVSITSFSIDWNLLSSSTTSFQLSGTENKIKF